MLVSGLFVQLSATFSKGRINFFACTNETHVADYVVGALNNRSLMLRSGSTFIYMYSLLPRYPKNRLVFFYVM